MEKKLKQILVVDDLATEREKISGILKDAGFNVSVAVNGEEAITMAKALRPSLIFMDIIMPLMDGYATCRKLMQDPDTKAIPVVFVSTKNQRADFVWAKMQGGRDLIAKPYQENDVLDALKYAA
jgi:twitching motility two-component system response regulator PilH